MTLVVKILPKRMSLKDYKYTVWNFQYFPYTQILREINFMNCRSSKAAILTISQALYFYFYEFVQF